MTRVGGDERRVLSHALPDSEALRVELALQLLPDQPVPARLGEALPEPPHRAVIRGLREPEETLEAQPVIHLPLQLRVTQPVPCLEDEELHHHHRVCVGASSRWALVAVHGLDDGCEGVPVDEGFDRC